MKFSPQRLNPVNFYSSTPLLPLSVSPYLVSACIANSALIDLFRLPLIRLVLRSLFSISREFGSRQSLLTYPDAISY